MTIGESIRRNLPGIVAVVWLNNYLGGPVFVREGLAVGGGSAAVAGVAGAIGC